MMALGSGFTYLSDNAANGVVFPRGGFLESVHGGHTPAPQRRTVKSAPGYGQPDHRVKRQRAVATLNAGESIPGCAWTVMQSMMIVGVWQLAWHQHAA
jgi:hypothetical protein